MIFPDSFLGARADTLVDNVILSFALIVPVLFYTADEKGYIDYPFIRSGKLFNIYKQRET